MELFAALATLSLLTLPLALGGTLLLRRLRGEACCLQNLYLCIATTLAAAVDLPFYLFLLRIGGGSPLGLNPCALYLPAVLYFLLFAFGLVGLLSCLCPLRTK